MKRIYWRPSGVSQQMLLLMSVIALSGMTLVEKARIKNRQPLYQEKLQAAKRMEKAFQRIGAARAKVSGHIDLDVDPAGSGLIGARLTEITSVSGNLMAKQTTINPNWAAVMVELFRRAKLKRGDVVAVGFSGSFPALNLATLIAFDIMGLRAIVTSGGAASMWGANLPDFTWLDMEGLLFREGLIRHKSVGASLGGQRDRGRGLSSRGVRALKEAIGRSGAAPIFGTSMNEIIDKKMALFEKYAEGESIAAYVNVGGNASSVGDPVTKRLFREGLNLTLPASSVPLSGLMSRFARQRIPVINMLRIRKLAERYGLPYAPQSLPNVGEGKIFAREEYNLWLVLFVLVVIFSSLFIFLKSDIGYRILSMGDAREALKPPGPMV